MHVMEPAPSPSPPPPCQLGTLQAVFHYCCRAQGYLIHDDVGRLSMQDTGEGYQLLAACHLLYQLVRSVPVNTQLSHEWHAHVKRILA